MPSLLGLKTGLSCCRNAAFRNQAGILSPLECFDRTAKVPMQMMNKTAVKNICRFDGFG